MVLGTPGGSTIITSVLQTILNVTEFKMGMQEAVNAPRFHHQWLPDEVLFEPNKFSAPILSNLTKKDTISMKNRLLLLEKWMPFWFCQTKSLKLEPTTVVMTKQLDFKNTL